LPRIATETLVVHIENPIYGRAQADYLHHQLPHSTFFAYDSEHWRWHETEDDLGADASVVLEYLTGTPDESAAASRLMIVLFVDIVGSTGIAARLGDREWVDTLRAFQREVQQQLSHYRGRIVHDTGDGFLAVLPTVRAALRFSLDVTAIGERLGTPARIGIHAGDCHVEGDELHGLAVHAAARLLDFGGRGDIVVTDAIVALSPMESTFEPLGERELRGVPGRFSLHRLEY
jgi:class 3 adenylate cyclase